ncbi:MAG: peptidoglycan-binding protein [Hyphomonadaceae bacterium]|nr:peptidoglycan-binding protein [Hyphomonadaceae bacterium]
MTATDYTLFTDVFLVVRDGAVLREYPEPDAAPLTPLRQGQHLRRLDTVNWNGAWLRFYADVIGGRKYEGYLYYTDVEQAPEGTTVPVDAAPPPSPPAAPPSAPPTRPSAGAATDMLVLGCVDPTVTDAMCAAYMKSVEQLTRVSPANVKDGLDKLSIRPLTAPLPGLMSIAEVQQALRTLGFFPGGETDGIYGYRTLSAIRLFQEYVRTMERQRCLPDGRFGPETQAHLKRWLATGQQPDWRPQPGEYEAWLSLLEGVKQKYLATPGPVLEKVNAFTGAMDTRKVANWITTGPGHIHLIGVRRQEATNKFDDIFVLLMKGLVFKFQGSTEPGSSTHEDGPPYIVQGQHDYRFGWHRSTYLALRPKNLSGVLVIRAGANKKLDDADLARGLKPEPSINIHWGGRGVGRDVKDWSEGCQVINGEVYVNPAQQFEVCSDFAATGSKEPLTKPEKTRGAYNVLVDVVTALSGDMPDNTVTYTLLTEADLDLAPPLKQSLADARARVLRLI